MDGWRDRIRSNVRGQDGWRRRRRRRRRESDTTPAILFLSSAATAFVAMTTQADDLIAVTFER